MYALTFLQVMIVDILEEVGKKTTEELCGLYGNRVIFFKYNVTNKEDCKGKLNLANEIFHLYYSLYSYCFCIFQYI